MHPIVDILQPEEDKMSKIERRGWTARLTPLPIHKAGNFYPIKLVLHNPCAVELYFIGAKSLVVDLEAMEESSCLINVDSSLGRLLARQSSTVL